MKNTGRWFEISWGVARLWLPGLLLLFGITSTPAQARPFAYVANLDSHDVSVIDLANNSVIATIPIGSGAVELAITPDGTRAYVTTGSSGTVKVIDTNPSSPTYNTVTATIAVGGIPQGIAISPDGALAYVTNDNGSVSAIDRGSDIVTAIPVGNRLNGVVFSSDSTLAYVVNYSVQDRLSVIDTASSAAVDTISAGFYFPEAIAITPDGALLYVTNPSRRSVTVVDTASRATVATVGLGSNPIRLAVSPDGSLVYVTEGSFTGSVEAIDTSSQTVVATVDVGRAPNGVAVPPDTARIYAALSLDNAVDVIDAATNIVLDRVSVGMSPHGIAITPFISDAAVNITAVPDPVAPGANITYTITVSNNGPDPAMALSVTDTLPDTTTFVSCFSTGTGVCSGSDNNQTVTFGSLPSGGSETITLVTRVNDSVAEQTVISNTAIVGSRSYDPDPSNNSSIVTVTVANP